MFKTRTPQPQVISSVGMSLAGWLCMAVGLGTLLIATRQNVSATEGSLGVLLIFLGFNAFSVMRITRLENRVTQLEATIQEFSKK